MFVLNLTQAIYKECILQLTFGHNPGREAL